MDVVFGRGYTIWNSNDAVAPDRDGWQKVRIDPDLIAARIAGISKGFCLYDDVGSEWEDRNGRFEYRYFPNRIMYSRESLKSRPWVEIDIKSRDLLSPDSITSIRVEPKELLIMVAE